jgi:molecular chaperone DnaK (HSP70)
MAIDVESPRLRPVWVGIDLGTTYSSLAYLTVDIVDGMISKKVAFATDPNGNRDDLRFVRSDVCAFLDGDSVSWLVGDDAIKKARLLGERAHVFRGYKLDIGDDSKSDDYNIRLPSNDPAGTTISVTPSKLAQRVVEHLRQLALRSELKGCDIVSISVSVPALWDERKSLVEQLVQAAGFGEVPVSAIEEPVAAFYCTLDSYSDLLKGPEKHVLVIDYGGGTCDCAVVRIPKNADQQQDRDEMVATVVGKGYGERGGLKIDRLILGLVRDRIPEFRDSGRIPDYWAMQQAELLKIQLSNQLTDFDLPLDDIKLLEGEVAIPSGERRRVAVTVGDLRELLSPELKHIYVPINQAITYVNSHRHWTGPGKFSMEKIAHCFLVGGSTLLPFVKESVQKHLGPIPVTQSMPRQAIAFGAARHAYYKSTNSDIGVGIVSECDVWLKSTLGSGVLLARKGDKLPLSVRKSLRVMPTGLGFYVEQVELEVFRGDFASANRDKRTLVKRHTPWRLSQPAPVFALVEMSGRVHETGFVDIELRYGEDKYRIDGKIPFISDTKAMAKRAGLAR